MGKEENKFGLVYDGALTENIPGKVNICAVKYELRGLQIAANIYVPADFDENKRYAAVVAAHPNGGVKEQVAGLYSQKLADMGYIAMAFDASYQGQSEGMPRNTDKPQNRVEDIHGAVDFIVNYQGVDRERVGILGICGGGGYTLRVAQTDKRIKAVATLSAFNTGIVRKNGFLDSQMDTITERFTDAYKAREDELSGKEVRYTPNMLDTMTPEEAEKMPFDLYKDGYVYYGITHKHTGSSFAYTVSSNMDLFAFDARTGMEMIDQPLLMMAGKCEDTLYMTEGCYERATGTKNKELFLIDGATHIKTYWFPEYVEKITNKLRVFWGKLMKNKKGMNALRVFGLLCCFAFAVSACGNSETNTTPKADTESNIETESDMKTENIIVEQNESDYTYLRTSTVGDVISDPCFEDFGRLLFPVDRTVSEDMTLEEISSSSVYIWYNYIDSDKTVEIIQSLHDRVAAGDEIFYDIYSEEEKEADPSKEDTGLFFFRGNPGEKFAVVNAGGGFMYVGAMHDSFPHALELSKMGYNSFALIYRPDDPYTDLAQAIAFIYDHAAELEVNTEDYSLWGGSAGARMAATLGNGDALYHFGRYDIPQASAVIMQYTGYSTVSEKDAPTYVCVGTNDGIASWRTMQSRLQSLEALGIPTEFHSYEGLPHGFGIGTGTIAEGWINDAAAFWEAQCE